MASPSSSSSQSSTSKSNLDPSHLSQSNCTNDSSLSTSSNEMMFLELVTPTSHHWTTLHTFHPSFTYPIYGEEETIVGYEEPELHLRFSSFCLTPMVSFTYKKKDSIVSHSDLIAPLLEYLPKDVFFDEVEYHRTITDRLKASPPGQKVHQYTSEGNKHFEIYACNFNTPGFPQLYDNMKILPLLYIEGGSVLDSQDQKWDFLVVYEKQHTPSHHHAYHFVGYCAGYSFYCFPDRLRRRLSQLIILPPYQRQGHALVLYSEYSALTRSHQQTVQLVIEDPSDTMDKIRDLGDLEAWKDFGGFTAFVPSHTTFESLFTRAKKGHVVQKLIKKLKLHPRQAERLYEMGVLQSSKPTKDFRLMVKLRIYRQNKEALLKLSPEEIKQKLHETYLNVLEEYLDRLESFNFKRSPSKPFFFFPKN